MVKQEGPELYIGVFDSFSGIYHAGKSLPRWSIERSSQHGVGSINLKTFYFDLNTNKI